MLVLRMEDGHQDGGAAIQKRGHRRHPADLTAEPGETAAIEYAVLPVKYAFYIAAQRLSLPSKAEECHHCPLDLNELLRR
jgi:hypothetical protein